MDSRSPSAKSDQPVRPEPVSSVTDAPSAGGVDQHLAEAEAALTAASSYDEQDAESDSSQQDSIDNSHPRFRWSLPAVRCRFRSCLTLVRTIRHCFGLQTASALKTSSSRAANEQLFTKRDMSASLRSSNGTFSRGFDTSGANRASMLLCRGPMYPSVEVRIQTWIDH